LRNILEELRNQIHSKKNHNDDLKEEYIYWKQQVGEKNAELEALRGNTSKQLASNSEFELEIEGYKKRNERLR
jgi:hypothetical protein